MKLTLIFTTAVIFLASCQEKSIEEARKEIANKEVMAGMQRREAAYMAQNAPKEHDFQRLARGGLKILPSEKTGITEANANLKAQQDFFIQSGFPIDMAGESILWAETTTWQQADKKYESFVKQHEGHLYLPVFRAAAAEIILKDAALLAENDQAGLDKIAFYVAEMVNNNSGNTAIVYYALNKVKNHIPKEKLSILAQLSYQANKENIKEMTNLQRFADNLVDRQRKAGANESELKSVSAQFQKGLVEPAEQKVFYLEKLKEFIVAAE